jgi:hypothetical protein
MLSDSENRTDSEPTRSAVMIADNTYLERVGRVRNTVATNCVRQLFEVDCRRDASPPLQAFGMIYLAKVRPTIPQSKSRELRRSYAACSLFFLFSLTLIKSGLPERIKAPQAAAGSAAL